MNIEHPTPNIEHPMFGIRASQYSMLDVGCLLAIDRRWMLDVVPLQVSRLCIATRQNHRAPQGFWTAVAERSGDTAFRLRIELPKRRGTSLPAAVQKDLVAAMPPRAFAPLR